MDEVVEGVVGIMQQQVLLLHIAEDGFAFVQAGQLHGLGFLDGTYALVGIGQMPQILHVEVLVSRNQLAAVDMESVYQEIKKILRHGTVVHKAAYISYLAFLYFSLYLFDDFGSVGGIVYQYIRIARNLDAITAVHFITGEDGIQIGLDDVFNEH